MNEHLEIWKRELFARPFRSTPALTENGIVHGFGTVLLKAALGVGNLAGAASDRLIALLAIAAGGDPHPDAALSLEVANRDWMRGDKALAAIRLAFAPVAKIADPERAYRLFLAEQALDAGLDPESVLREFGLGASAALLKYNRTSRVFRRAVGVRVVGLAKSPALPPRRIGEPIRLKSRSPSTMNARPRGSRKRKRRRHFSSCRRLAASAIPN